MNDEHHPKGEDDGQGWTTGDFLTPLVQLQQQIRLSSQVLASPLP